MWDEDPRYQKAMYHLLVRTVVAGTAILAVIYSLEGDWKSLQRMCLVLGAIVAALCLYAAVVWMVVHAVRFLVGLARKIFKLRF